MISQQLLQQILELNDDDRRELRDALGDSLPVEISPELGRLLDERLADARAHPNDSIPWEQVRAKAKTRLAAHGREA